MNAETLAYWHAIFLHERQSSYSFEAVASQRHAMIIHGTSSSSTYHINIPYSIIVLFLCIQSDTMRITSVVKEREMTFSFDQIDRALEAIERSLLPYGGNLPLTVVLVGATVMSGDLISQDEFLESIDPENYLSQPRRGSSIAGTIHRIVVNEYLHLREVVVICDGRFSYVAPAQRIRKQDISSWSIGRLEIPPVTELVQIKVPRRPMCKYV